MPGGVLCEGPDAAALACLGSRLAESVLLRLWEGSTKELRSARRFAAAAAGELPLLVRTEGERATLSVDAAGSPLFRRGWRARVGAAPLRETLAAALLRTGGWRGDRPFCDPMCGSGTIVIEAALSAAGRAPGLDRSLALEALPGMDPTRLDRLRASLRSGARPVNVPILASDRNAGVLRLARKNAEAAGVEGVIRFERCDAADAPVPEGPGLCVANPPWGLRLGEGAEASWVALGRLARRLGGWRMVALAPEKGLAEVMGITPASALAVRNGGVSCRIAVFELRPG